MCSPGGLILILLTALLFYNCVHIVDSHISSTTATDTTTAAYFSTASLGGGSHSNSRSQGGGHTILDDDFENVLLHASHAHTLDRVHHSNSGYDDDDNDVDGTVGESGQFIDITRKHKIHYNGIVIDEENLIEHLEDHERELIFGKSRKTRSIKLVHLTYRPTATATKTAAAAPTPTDVAGAAAIYDDNNKLGEVEEELELQIPNNSLETATAGVVHRFKRSDNEPTSSAKTTTPTTTNTLPKRQGGAPALPVVSVQIKDNDHLVNLRLQQTPKLIDDAFVFIRRYANTSQLVENSHKLVERLEKCFYHNENSALDLCDDENVRGVYHHNQTDYIIHPLPKRFGNKTHIILETETEVFDTLYPNSTVLDGNIQFEPEQEDFNDLNVEAIADHENSTTSRTTRNIETDGHRHHHQGQQTVRSNPHHNPHRIPLNLRYKPRHHHNHQLQHQQHQHKQNTNNHHSQKRHLHHHNKHHQHHTQSESQKSSKRSRRFISTGNERRGSSDVLHIETAIFVDTDLYKHMAKNFPKDTSSHLIRFVLAMINGVQLLYQHPSLGRRVNFVLKRLEILEKDPVDLMRSSDIDIYLSNFCKWQTRWNSPTDSKLHYDHAVILTGLDLYVVNKNGKVISQVVGLAPVAGMCIETSSCTINEGKHFESVFVVAHEIGHNLGMRHDSTENGCDPTSHIMSPTLGSGKITWSKCSRDSLNIFLEKKQADCLFKGSEFNHNLDHSAEGMLPGERFDANQQCLLKYGKESARARSQSLADICRDLHCQRDRYTWTSHPALEGTSCGDNLWCRSGFCVIKRNDLYSASKQPSSLSKTNYDKSNFLDNSKASNLLHEYQRPSSSWSEWSEPSPCDSSCLYGPSKRLLEGSTGLKTVSRKCVDYKRRCMGRDSKYETCVAKQCYSVPMITIEDFARQVCERAQKFDSDLTGEGAQISGSIEESCKIYCKTKANGTKSRSWTFPDGTTCHSKLYNNDEPSYCIQGRCEKFSCDNSTANYYKIDNKFCKRHESSDNNSMDNETIRRSSTASSSSASSSHQIYSNHIPIGPPATQSTSYNNYDNYKYRNDNRNYYDHGTGSDRIYGPTTVRSKYENEVALKPYHGQFNHDAPGYKRKSDNYPPWNKYSYHLNDHQPSETSPTKSYSPVTSMPHVENDWIVKSGCHSSCMARSKGIQVVLNRKTGVKNIQLCTHAVKPCDRLQTTAEYSDHTCSRYKLKVRGLSGHGTQIAASVEDPDRSCRVGCQDEFIQHRFYLVNGNYGHFPLGTRCASTEDRYCVQGKCLEFGPDQIPLKQSHISLALFRSRRSAMKHRLEEQHHSRKKRSFLYYDPVNITETLTQDFINNIVNSIITLEEKQIKDDSLLGDHIEFTNPIHFSMDVLNEK